MSDDIKRIDIAEFRALGFIQEINRRILHPCGLALEVVVAEDGTETLGGVWDYRDDPEGIYYGPDVIDKTKADTVLRMLVDNAPARIRQLGWVVQPS